MSAPAQDLPAALGYRWVILFFAWITFLLSFIDRLIWGNAAVSVGASLGLPIAALGIFVTAFYVGYVVFNILGGLACDRIGARLTLSLSMIVLGACTFLFSFVPSVSVGLALQTAMGLAAGADYAAGVKLIVGWFDRGTRGRAMGLYMTASSLGVTVTNATVPTLLTGFGWQNVYKLFGIVTIIVGLLALWRLRDGPQPIARRGRSCSDLVLLLRNRNLLFLALAGFGALWGTWGFAFWTNALMIHGRHLTPVDAGMVLALAGAAAILGKPVIGLVSDWLGGGYNKALIIAVLLGFTAMLLVFGSLQSTLGFEIAAPFIGFCAFVYSPLMAAVVAEAAGLALAGSASGLTAGFWQLGSMIVPLVVGVVFQSTGSFPAAFGTLAAGPFLGALCMLFVRTGERHAPTGTISAE